MGTPHDRRMLCLSSALADRYEGHETLESMPSPQNMHDGGRLSIHGRRHASALCALQRRTVAQIAPHIVLHCRPRSLDGVDRSGSHCAPYKSADSGSEAPGFTSYIRTSSVRYICACSCHCLLRAGSRIFTYCLNDREVELRTEIPFPSLLLRRTSQARSMIGPCMLRARHVRDYHTKVGAKSKKKPQFQPMVRR